MSAVAWLESLSPWPSGGFGTDRMRTLLAELGDPQAGLPAVHVVGTNGKSTTTRLVEELLLANGVRAGAYLSPHVRSWAERIRVEGREANLDAALEAVRPAAEPLGATQFEVLTAAAFVAFRTASVEGAAVEAGLGGRHDATNVLDATRVVVLTNVSLEHTEVLGTTREAIAAEKLAVVRPGCTVVVGEPEWEDLARAAGGGTVLVEPGGSPALARMAARAFLGREIDDSALGPVALPGRLERREGEVRDGAHNAEGVRWLVEHLPRGDYTVMASILADKDADGMLEALAVLGRRFVACRSSNPRALPSAELADRAQRVFDVVRARDDPREALALAHELGEPVLVTGSLYLLADLEADHDETSGPR
ncbi:MAG TPA: Mur ligase family protein [Gaiella sp.]|jgi:dihydrofolate synthase/folylpolyglutamate synthase|nr:Mur ligase family protein [Gaiella sp.]